MKPFERVTTIAGCLLLLGALLLASPGVRVVRAAEEGVAEAAPTAPGGSCNAAAAAPGDPVEAFLAQLQSQYLSAGLLEGGPVVLNSRGYNYGVPPSPDLGRIKLDARLQGRR